MPIATRSSIPVVVQQHLEDATNLRSTRSVLVRAPHVRLHQLQRLDERLAAHLDGLYIAGDFARDLSLGALDRPASGALFVAGIGAIHSRDAALLDKLLAIAEADTESRAGLVSAFGWASAISLRGITKALLDSRVGFRRDIGLAACAMHQVDPGPVLLAALGDPSSPHVALKVAGLLGRRDTLPACLGAMAAADPAIRFLAARAAVLLGDRDQAVATLRALSLAPGPHREQALCCWLKVSSSQDIHAVLKTLTGEPAAMRLLIRGVGLSGDVHYVPWLLKQMGNPVVARLAGESLSLITGLDLAGLDLERSPTESVPAGPDDNPDDPRVALDEDESLPWPDADKLAAWWQHHGSRFTPGTRYFMGETLSPAHCSAVLKTGFQRERSAAAVYLSLLQPGTSRFNTFAPAWRQQRLLGLTSTPA